MMRPTDRVRLFAHGGGQNARGRPLTPRPCVSPQSGSLEMAGSGYLPDLRPDAANSGDKQKRFVQQKYPKTVFGTVGVLASRDCEKRQLVDDFENI